jgi:hypothetical protein
MGARADRLNRVVLTILGLLLLAAGVTGLLVGLGVFGADAATNRVLAPDVEPWVERNADWFWPAVALVAVLLALLALRWVVQQLRTDRVGDLDLTVERDRGETRVDAGAVTDALVASVEELPGVDSASSRLLSRHGSRTLLLQVRLADRADARAVRSALAAGPLTELRQVLGTDTAPRLRVELEPSSRGSSRSVA